MKRNPPQIVELPHAKGVDHWRKVLLPAGLSLLPGTFDKVQGVLQQPNVNADQVAHALSSDPAACLHFYLKASPLLQASGNEIRTLSHLISLLGFPKVRQILHSLPVADEPMPQYWQHLQRSLWCARLIPSLPLHTVGIQADELYLSAMFGGLADWLRWHFAAQEQAWFEGLSRNPKIGPQKANQLVFGTDLHALIQAQLTRISLPQLLKHALTMPRSTLHQQLHMLSAAQRSGIAMDVKNRRLLVLKVILLLARRLWEAPDQQGTRLCQQFLAQLLQYPEARIAQAVHINVGQLPLLHATLLDAHPARRLLCHWPRFAHLPTYSLPRPQIKTPPPVSASPAPPSRLLDNRFADPALVRDNLRSLSNGADHLTSLNAILECAQETLSTGMGMQLGAFLVRNTDAGWQLRYEFQQHNDLRLPPKITDAHLLNKLTTKPSTVLINRDNRTALHTHLPAELHTPLATLDALFISLFLGDKLIALLLTAEADLAPPRVQVCKRLAQATQQAIARLAIKVQRQAAGQH